MNVFFVLLSLLIFQHEVHEGHQDNTKFFYFTRSFEVTKHFYTEERRNGAAEERSLCNSFLPRMSTNKHESLNAQRSVFIAMLINISSSPRQAGGLLNLRGSGVLRSKAALISGSPNTGRLCLPRRGWRLRDRMCINNSILSYMLYHFLNCCFTKKFFAPLRFLIMLTVNMAKNIQKLSSSAPPCKKSFTASRWEIKRITSAKIDAYDWQKKITNSFLTRN